MDGRFLFSVDILNQPGTPKGRYPERCVSIFYTKENLWPLIVLQQKTQKNIDTYENLAKCPEMVQVEIWLGFSQFSTFIHKNSYLASTDVEDQMIVDIR